MPELKQNFQAGRMNKDLDERLVPKGEYRDALNIEVSTSEDSDVGSLQTVMGNELVGNAPGGTCVGSIVNEKNDKLYYLVQASGMDFIAEYDPTTTPPTTLPVCVDIHGNIPANRVLNFSSTWLITGINIIDDTLFWTDNNTEPKRIHIGRGKAGSTGGWGVHTNLMVRDISLPASIATYINGGPIREEHLTVIRMSPPTAPVLEMNDTVIGDINLDGTVGLIDGVVAMTDAAGDPINPFVDAAAGGFQTVAFPIQFNGPPYPDFDVGDYLIARGCDDPAKKIRVLVTANNCCPPTPIPIPGNFTVEFQAGTPDVHSSDVCWDVELEQVDPLFQFKFPRFGYRYKYEDGEYSCFSPFTEVAFLPGDFYYLPREGYNLGMVNNIRQLAIKDFVHPRLLPDDVISIDILYKESNSPNIYSVKTIKRKAESVGVWDSWNGYDNINTAPSGTRGYLPIKSEMIHAILPANQLLRPWDNVPRKALTQEITKNRLVYGNYLQNYDLFSLDPPENNIEVGVNVIARPKDITGTIKPEQYDAKEAYNYRIGKSVKSLRTYQVGVVYIDEYGRETPVFSNSLKNESSIYIDKGSADKQNKLGAQVVSTAPAWARTFKFFVKETSNEYYNLSMDRWYDAEDGNIWLSFPSSERNKVDIDTFLVLKKEHDNNNFVDEPARYKILAIENEAPSFVKIDPQPLGIFEDTSLGDNIGIFNGGGTGWPFVGDKDFMILKSAMDIVGWSSPGPPYTGTVFGTDLSAVFFRFKGALTYSKWYALSSVSLIAGGTYYELATKVPFGDDMGITSKDGTYTNRAGGLGIEMVRRDEVNKPEFEGRFFVKILKDHTIKKRIIHSQGTGSYIVQTTAMSTYINPQPTVAPDAFHGGPDAVTSGVPPSPNNWFGCNVGRISHQNDFGSGWGLPSGASNGQGQTYWNQAGNTSTLSGAPGFFIDKIEGFRPYNNMVDKYWWNVDGGWRTDPVNPVVPCTIGVLYLGGGGVSAMTSYMNPPKGTQVIGTGTHTSAITNSSYLVNGNVRGPNTAGFSNLFNSAQGQGGGIVPSVGIDQTVTGNTIHLSYSGITYENSSADPATTTGGFAFHDFLADPVKHTGDLLFINEICTPGTVWRWREDPGQVLYQTMQPGTTAASTPQTTLEWQLNSTDNQIAPAALGVTLFNYVKMSDWALDHGHHDTNCTVWGVQICSNDMPGWATSPDTPHSTPCPACCEDPFNHSAVRAWTAPVSGSASPHGGNLQNRFPTYVPRWRRHENIRRRFQFKAEPYDNPGGTIGGEGPHFYTPVNNSNWEPHFDSTGTALVDASGAIPVAVYPSNHPNPALAGQPLPDKAPGIRNDGMHSGYGVAGSLPFPSPDPLNNTAIPNIKQWDSTGGLQSTMPGSVTWEILEPYAGDDTKYSSKNPGIWETEPKEDVGLDIYHEVGQMYPIELNGDNIEQFVGGISLNLITNSFVKCWNPGGTIILTSTAPSTDIRVADANGTNILLTDLAGNILSPGGIAPNCINNGGAFDDTLIFIRSDGSATEGYVKNVLPGGWFELWENVDKNLVLLPFHNCYSFGNGVESDRIRDDFNQVTIDNGPKASTTLEEPYLEERRASGLIYSGIYNSISGINNLNQFIQAEKITKDLNPVYGSIQKLFTRNTDLLTLCEDKVFKILANKDALYNADGNMNLTATANVLGQTIPLMGEYGISKNPESFASESYRAYFSDRTRGVVLRLSQDGLTPISDYGMKDWFADNLPLADRIIGSFDDEKQTYNITLFDVHHHGQTVSFTENVKGWPSFKSFLQEDGLSLNNTYYTMFRGQLYEHHLNPLRNNFYNWQFDSHVDVLFNDAPGSVKSFQTLNYEGTQARITPDINNNMDYYDNFLKTGWYVEKIMTILHQGSFATYGNWVDQDEFLDNRLDLGSQIPIHTSNWHTDHSGKNTGLEFWDKEGKWFSQIKGIATEWLPDGRAGNIDTQEFSYQGIGNAGVECPRGCPTSWRCIETWVDENSCEISGFTKIVPATPFLTDEDFVQYLSDPMNGHTSTDPHTLYSCVESSNVISSGHCQCGTSGVLVRGYKLDFGMMNGSYSSGFANYTSWDGFLTTLINACSSWATNCPVIPGMTYNQLKSALSLWGFTQTPQVKWYLTIAKPVPCRCTRKKECECIEVPGTNYHPTKPDCENAQNCCHHGAPCIPCNDPNAYTFFPGCCHDTQLNYDPNATCDDGTCIPILYGCTDNGDIMGDPVLNQTWWDDTSTNQYALSSTFGQSYSTTSFIATYPGYAALNYFPSANVDDGTCFYQIIVNPIYGCTDPNATNYNPAAGIDDGSCLYLCTNLTDLDVSSSPNAVVNSQTCPGNVFQCQWGAFPNNETAIEAIATIGITTDFRDYRFLRNDYQNPTDLYCSNGCSAACSGSACCDTNDSWSLPNPLYYYYWRQNARINHKSINNWLGYTKWFFTWKDLIDEAYNSGQMTNPDRIYDPLKANTTANYVYTCPGAGGANITYDAQGYAISFAGVEVLIAGEFLLAGISSGGDCEDALGTSSTVCDC